MPDFASFQPVLLWSDVLVWLLVGVSALGAGQARRNTLSRAAWARVGRSRPGMTAVTVLTVFVLIGLIDSLHYRPRLPGDHADAPPVYAVEVRSLLDALAAPLRERHEKTYSAPLATRAYAKESLEMRGEDGRVHTVREFPRLRYGGAHLGDAENRRNADVRRRMLAAAAFAAGLTGLLALGVTFFLARR